MNKASYYFWNNDQGAPIGAIFFLFSVSSEHKELVRDMRFRCRVWQMYSEQDKQPTGSAWPWRGICRGTLTRQTKHEAVSAGSSDGKWGVRRCCLPCGCSCVFASVISSTWWLWLNNILSGDTENSRLCWGLIDNACQGKVKWGFS